MDIKGTQPYVYMYPFSLKLLSCSACHIALSRVPCAIQWDLVVYLIFLKVFSDCLAAYFFSLCDSCPHPDGVAAPGSQSCGLAMPLKHCSVFMNSVF